MRRSGMISAMTLALWTSGLLAADSKPPATAPEIKPNAVGAVHPHLPSGVLTHAALAELAKGTLLRAGDLTITEKGLAERISEAPEELREQLRRSSFFILEEMATEKLVLQAAKAHAAKASGDVSKTGDRELIQSYLTTVADAVKVADEEVAQFYKANKEMFGQAKLEEVRPGIARFLTAQKQQEAVDRHIATLGQRMTIEVAAGWARQQAEAARDNPVDKARASGRPSLADFGAKGCHACDMMEPILADLTQKYDGRMNVLFVHVREQPVLAARYGIRSIPVQVFFDKDGKEVFRHVGFFPQEAIEKKLAELGVK